MRKYQGYLKTKDAKYSLFGRLSLIPVSLFKVVLLLIFSFGLTGCAVIDLMRAAPINEQIKPQSVICGNDGTVAIRVTSSYTHCSFTRMFLYHHFLMFFEWLKPKNEYDPYKEVVLRFRKSRDRYLVLDPATIRGKIQGISPEPGGIYSIDRVSFADPDYTDFLSAYLFGNKSKRADEVTFIPKGFWASSPDPRQLPAALRPAAATEHPLNGPIPYKLNTETVHLKFDRFTTRGRTGFTWWSYPIMIGFYYAPLTVTAVAYKLPQLPFIILGHALAPKEDNRFTKPQSEFR